ncbi:MAG: hypothetical protein Q2306_02505 (plasmid) [Phytoplasma sp.]|uniref:hypothetical protein n=1 Tax=Phytoplasma sp. TaxID=2155 RepID=UPI002B404C03|nr:hypothetical protein [Phytoplasma sp.]WRH06978.1 MAG: hypothetical protein Q2306_02505 [Phytoplasma sp.]
MNLKPQKNKIFISIILIFLLIIMLLTSYILISMKHIEDNRKDIEINNETISDNIQIVEKKIPVTLPCPNCVVNKKIKELFQQIEKIQASKEITNTEKQKQINQIQEEIIENNFKTKFHHYIVPDSEFESKYYDLKNITWELFINNPEKATLMHKFIKKLNPEYKGWICSNPSFNENNDKVRIMTEVKHPPCDLVGIYFDKGKRFNGDDTDLDWDKYTYDEVIKATSGAENVYIFWRTREMANKFIQKVLNTQKFIDPNKRELNGFLCPSNAKLLTEQDIENL